MKEKSTKRRSYDEELLWAIIIILMMFITTLDVVWFGRKEQVAKTINFAASSTVQTITLDRNGGSGYPVNIYVKDGIPYGQSSCAESSKMTKFVIPTKSGYKFIGYYSGNDEYVSSDGTINLTLIKNHYMATKGDYTITAKWEKVQKITLDKNSGTDGSPTVLYHWDKAVYSDSTCTTKITKVTPPTRSNYEFTGFTHSTGSKIIDNNGTINLDAINGIGAAVSSDYTATAQWEKLQYVTINANGGSMCQLNVGNFFIFYF